MDPYFYKDIGDSKKATEVILTLVDGVTVDSRGNLFVSHRSKNRIHKVGKDGIITTIAGNGTAGFTELPSTNWEKYLFPTREVVKSEKLTGTKR